MRSKELTVSNKSSPAEKAKWQQIKDTAASDFKSHRYLHVSTPAGSHLTRQQRTGGGAPKVVTGRTAIRSRDA